MRWTKAARATIEKQKAVLSSPGGERGEKKEEAEGGKKFEVTLLLSPVSC